MNYKIYCVSILILLRFFEESDAVKNKRFPASRAFLVYRTVSITQKSCTSATPYSYSCCQRITILYTKAEKDLCVNFTYQSNGLNVDVSLQSIVIKARTVTDYKPLKFCVYVPGCLFSSACVDILELNRFPRSITACLRLDIFSKKKLWQINYDCISVSTELPTTPDNATMSTGNTMAMTATTSSMMASMMSPTMASMMTPTVASMMTPTMGSMMSSMTTSMMTTRASSMMASATAAMMTSSATSMMTSRMPSMMITQTSQMASMTTAGTLMPRNQTMMMTMRATATGELEALELKEAITESMMNNNE